MTNATIPIIREIAQFMAELVSNHVYPGEYHRVHISNGRQFEVIVRPYVTKDDTLPVFGRHDEDNGVAD